MSGLPMVGAQAPPSAWKMIRAMVGIGLLCGLLIVTVFVWTKPVIERNRAEALQRAIFQVLPEAKSIKSFRLAEERFVALAADGDAADEDSSARVYAGYDEGGRLAGLAIEARGMGYQDVITVIYGYSFGKDAIVGIRVLESKETPGLGDRIETDPEFLQNFERLDVALSADLSAVAHPIEAVKHGKKTDPWQIDGITGATISSVAIAGMLRESTAFWVPQIRERLDDFRQSEAP